MPAKTTYYKKKLWKVLEDEGVAGEGLAAFVNEACWLLLAVNGVEDAEEDV